MADQTGMDAAAREAAAELNDLPAEHVVTVAAWWVKHFATAGHKRLGRALIKQHTKAVEADKEA